MSSELLIETDLEGSRRGLTVRYEHDICLDGQTKTTMGFSQDKWFPDQDLNPIPAEHNAGIAVTLLL
jgi:hypothetical protein